MAVVEPAYKAESGQDGFSPSVDVRYRIFEADELSDAMAALYAETPAYWDLYGDATVILPKAGIACERLTEEAAWDGVVTYQVQTAQTVAPPDADPEFSFDTSGETQKVMRSIATVRSYPEDVAPDFSNAIGVTKDGIEGADIIVPGYRWTETHYISNANITSSRTARIEVNGVPKNLNFPSYKKMLSRMTGTVHGIGDNEFRNYAPGEVLLLGAQGSRRGSSDWQITFSFAQLPNNTEENDNRLTVGDLENITKLGWEYLWIRTLERKIGSPPDEVVSHVPSYAYVEKVYPYSDFSGLGIGMDEI